MESFSVFDIIGPRMTGPSSSHTAGAVRLGYIARRIIGEEIISAHFTLYGSFAETGRGHGTDKALIAGLLGCMPDDARIRSAYKLARDSGVQIEITYSEEAADHPNTVLIEATDVNGRETRIIGRSVGGGNILITEINGLKVGQLSSTVSNVTAQMLTAELYDWFKSQGKEAPVLLSANIKGADVHNNTLTDPYGRRVR